MRILSGDVEACTTKQCLIARGEGLRKALLYTESEKVSYYKQLNTYGCYAGIPYMVAVPGYYADYTS